MCSSRPATKTTQLFWSGVYHKLPSNPVGVCVQRPHTMKRCPGWQWQAFQLWIEGRDRPGVTSMGMMTCMSSKNPRAWREWSRVLATTGDLKGNKHLRISNSCQARGSGFTYLIMMLLSTTLCSRYYAFTIPGSCPSVSALRTLICP